MKTKLLQLIGATALLFGAGGVALANTVGFIPNPAIVEVGVPFDVDIVGIGFTDVLAGGTFDLGFDSNHLEINSVTIDLLNYEFLPDPGRLISPGLWGTVGFDTFSPTPPTGDFRIATINLTALVEGTSNLVILNSEFFDDKIGQLDPALPPGVVSSVPVPAAVWLFVSGLLGLIGVARRKVS